MARYCRSFTSASSRSRTVASSPHWSGLGRPVSGATRLAVARNTAPMKPPGVQFAIAICPPDRQTRRSSAATRPGRGANIAPNMLTTRSKAPEATGRFSASPASNLMSSFSRVVRARLIDQIGRNVDAGNGGAGIEHQSSTASSIMSAAASRNLRLHCLRSRLALHSPGRPSLSASAKAEGLSKQAVARLKQDPQVALAALHAWGL
jgi:hypothetical protein